MTTARIKPVRDIIGIGASLGGVEALTTLFSLLPPELPGLIFVVLHRSQLHPPRWRLADVLARRALHRVVEPVQGQRVEPGGIYLAPQGAHMTVHDDTIDLNAGPKVKFTRPAIDPLFRSLARRYARRVAGIVLTGCGTDGTHGLTAISAAGGLSLVQDPVEAYGADMPGNAIRKDNVDCVLSLTSLALSIPLLMEGTFLAEGLAVDA